MSFLFLPAAGARQGAAFNGPGGNVNSAGCNTSKDASNWHFFATQFVAPNPVYAGRYQGDSVRLASVVSEGLPRP